MTTVSVIIPAYNQAAYVGQAIQSVLDQTFPDFELVVVDDGSTDDTPRVLTSFQDPRLRVIRQANAGLSAARNAGLRHASAAFVIFLDADDLLYQNALESHLSMMQARPAEGVTVGGYIRIDAAGKPLTSDLFPPAELSFSILVMGNLFPIHSVMLRREWLEKAGPFDEALAAGEDWDMWLRLSSTGCPFTTFGRTVCAYRTQIAQMTRQSARMRKATLEVLDKTFRNAQLRPEIEMLRSQAYAIAYVRASAREYREYLIDEAQRDLDTALTLDSTLLADDGQALFDDFIGWALDPNTSDPIGFLKIVFDNLPRSIVSTLRFRKNEALSALCLEIARASLDRSEWRKAGRSMANFTYFRPHFSSARLLVTELYASLRRRQVATTP